jgi:protein-tyrosine-phosphatase
VPFKVLFVCSANVCRSPSAAFLLASHLLEAGCLPKVAVLSAGTDAAVGEPWCPRCRDKVDRSKPELKRLVDWRAAQLSYKQFEEAGLVLCADRVNVSKVLRGQPTARGRVFTMIEAAGLAAHVTRNSTSAPASSLAAGSELPENGSSLQRLHWLVSEMDAVRGTVPRPPGGRINRLLRRDEEPDGLEVLDVHARGRRAHAEMLRSMGTMVDSLGPALAAAARIRGDRTAGG